VLAAGLSPAELVQDYERLVEIVEPDSLPHLAPITVTMAGTDKNTGRPV
jgi:hypothetical protein